MSRKTVGVVLTGLVAATLYAVPAIGEGSEPTPASTGFPAPKDSDADGVLDASTTAAALSGAADKDRPVEDLSQRTETFSTLANPDGTFSATNHASPVRVKQGDEWIDIDPTLQKQADGSYKPKASSADVRISGGGSKEAARITFGSDESFAVTWPQALPAPTVDGAVATYRLSAATDLLVTATPSGVATHLRLNSQPSADDPAFTFGLTTENLKVKEAPGGGLKVTDDNNNAQVGTTSSLVAWDSRTDAAGDIAKIVPLEATLSHAKTEGDNTKQTLNLQAPAGYLSDPKTVYPVIIDPDINAVNEVRDTYTRSGYTTPTGHLPYLMVGREAGSSNTNPARTLISYETTVLAGKTITAASLNFYQYFGGSCSAKNVNIDPLTAEFHATTTVDTNRPGINTGTGSSAVLSASRGPSCTDGSGFVSANVLGLAKLWAKGPSNGGLYNWGVQLDVPSASGSDATFERRFCSMEPSTNTAIPCSSAARVPFMKFTYNDPAPVAPPAPTVSIDDADATISTTVTGSRATALRARFLVMNGTTTVFDGYSASVPGGDIALVVLPQLAIGTYTVKAWTNDGGQSSAVASASTTFVIADPDSPTAFESANKQLAVDESTTLAPEDVVVGSLEFQTPSPDSGAPALVAEVKSAIPELFTTELELGEMPDVPPVARLAAVQDVIAADEVSETVEDVWVQAAVASETADWEDGLEAAAIDPTYVPYDVNNFAVTEWQGVTVNGDTATAVFMGHKSFSLPTGWTDDPDGQFQIKLKKSPDGLSSADGWQFVSVDAIPAQDLEVVE